MQLLCDEMLANLARWLRAAGHDTTLAEPGTPDATLIDLCRAERRVLITRDRQLVREAGDGIDSVLLTGENPDAHAALLADRLGLDWTKAPFTRCMLDNTPLRPAYEDEIAGIPPQSRALPGPFRTCPCCGRVFWPGSHVRRMIAQLERWRAASPPVSAPEG